TDPMIDIIMIGTVGAIVGARTYYVLTTLERYDSFTEMIDLRNGGLAIYGGIIGAFVCGGLACKWRKVNVLDMFDLAALAFPIGQAVGRWGNFMNQEAFGSNTTLPWGMYSNETFEYLSSVQSSLASQGVTVDPTLPVHPCFLYESLWCITGFILLHFLSQKRRFKGETILQYIVWYGLGRFFIEWVRTDSLMIGPFKISQIVAAVCVVVGITLLLVINTKIKKNNKTESI
ncbi:MAG: prolipoprotein diacylglyceryl transferase, partial [Clostridia bacterium]|nr:prolipoprotein diacylglyceryl transferase [Clostridia bacterium]